MKIKDDLINPFHWPPLTTPHWPSEGSRTTYVKFSFMLTWCIPQYWSGKREFLCTYRVHTSLRSSNMRPEYPITLPLPFLKLFHIIIFFIHCIQCIVSIWYQTNLTNFIHGSYSREPTVIARPLNPPVTRGRRSSLIGNRRVRGRIRHGNSI